MKTTKKEFKGVFMDENGVKHRGTLLVDEDEDSQRRKETGDTYWCISDNGEVLPRDENKVFRSINEHDYLSGNYFNTKEEAEESKKDAYILIQIKRTIRRLNEGWVYDGVSSDSNSGFHFSFKSFASANDEIGIFQCTGLTPIPFEFVFKNEDTGCDLMMAFGVKAIKKYILGVK